MENLTKYHLFYIECNKSIKKLSEENSHFDKKNDLIKICSIEEKMDNVVNVTFLIPNAFDVIKITKKLLEKTAAKYEIKLHYLNLSGDVFDR